MSLENVKIGIAFTGSFCTYNSVFPELEKLADKGAYIQTIFSNTSQSIDSRFGEARNFLERAKDITGNDPILTIEDAEPIGPKALLDILVILPCTGNTLAKLSHGITDSPVLMAAKAHLRNDRPLVLSLSTNDALGMNLKNIGLVLNVKNIYFVPFGQDDPIKKPNSMIAHTSLLVPTLEQALHGKQLQPVIQSPF
ncbi:MAG: dipicolinate synthase subunit B [Lachnospiraceae bacterium]|nr:dipicolinate synthase subunit B [Lachnospiraceae bacterium]